MERTGPDDDRSRPPSLRIAGYVPGHAERTAARETEERSPQVNWPDIADYWPAAPREERAPEPKETRPATRKRIALAGGVAMLVIGGAVLLARPLHTAEVPGNTAAQAPTPEATTIAPQPPVSVAPATTAAPSATPSAPPSSVPAATTSAPATGELLPVVTSARFELATGVTELSVSTAALDGEYFTVSTPDDSGLKAGTTFTDGVLRVSATSTGEAGSGKLVVRLSRDVTWHLRMTGGVARATFAMGGAKVSRVDLDGGAERIDLTLDPPSDTLPIRMTGGVATWRIRTGASLPVQVRVRNGAGGVTLYGEEREGIAAGTTIRDGDVADDGLDIDAREGFGTLTVSKN
ncbi:hypothetical protein [Actinoplanes sp. NBRC 101535]|uniref:hypothetical protein n=1 Tax=Actinoplanes sp. NBRC 101535 TaxID=3032196 RepID=UPI0024A33074|nr:hypothetical protein [Actinoplanes sp. NBRC 101535]GLY07424.1 hypothetical protein Acsp01_78030 [Actinoplanes sp. NBRC 101535]